MSLCTRWTVKTDKFTTLHCLYSVIFLFYSTVCSQNRNKPNLNLADETHTDYSFLSRYHFTKSKNYLKRRYRIRHWIPMFIGTPCIKQIVLTVACKSTYWKCKRLYTIHNYCVSCSVDYLIHSLSQTVVFLITWTLYILTIFLAIYKMIHSYKYITLEK